MPLHDELGFAYDIINGIGQVYSMQDRTGQPKKCIPNVHSIQELEERNLRGGRIHLYDRTGTKKKDDTMKLKTMVQRLNGMWKV